MIDKVKNKCYSYYSEIQKGREQQSPIQFVIHWLCLRTVREIWWRLVEDHCNVKARTATNLLTRFLKMGRDGLRTAQQNNAPCRKCGRVSSRTFVSLKQLDV